jgi:predicted nucleic acid-binding protein
LLLKKIKDIASENFVDAVNLGDKNSKTLGFLPKSAFEKYAKSGQLIGAFDTKSNEFLGYLLYRISYNRVTIVHCCIDSAHRNKNVAQKLVTNLKQTTKQYDGIKLSCRNDYGIDKVWERFNFVPIKEKKGRSKLGLPLTIWWYPHYQNNLLSQISDFELSNKIVAVIDMNIFLDIKEEREEESLALKSDWLLSEAVLYYTREIYNEINRGKTQSEKNKNRSLLSYYKELPFNEEEFTKVLNELKNEFLRKNENDKSDLNHLAYSISGGAQYFITRDENLLKNKSFFSKYDLVIYRPSEFITRLDENIQVSKYKPQKLIGTSINSISISSENIDYFTNLFRKPSERKSKFQKTIRDCLSSPNLFELQIISLKNKELAFVIFDRSTNNSLKIPVFRFLNNNLKNTLSKHILYKAISLSIKENRNKIVISDQSIDTDIESSIIDTKFLKIENNWIKINLKGITDIKNIDSLISELPQAKNIISKINSNHSNPFLVNYNIERHFSPLKVKELDIPTYIIPIKPVWSENLFDDKSNEELALFESNYELLLNRENVYYRSALPKILESPSRILWYVSENKSTKNKGFIRASSYIDEIFIDHPKKLFKQFEQLGVYKWEHISKTAKDKEKMMAFVFSDTELFKKNISLKNISEVFKNYENKKFMAVTPIKIKTETYLALYKLGNEL